VINDEQSRAFVLRRGDVVRFASSGDNAGAAHRSGAAGCHVKGGDYRPDDLPESATVGGALGAKYTTCRCA
jgi:hypothetical protein